MSNTIKVINNKDRYFNGARKGQILTIDSNRKDYYLRNGFAVVENVIEKTNIVKENEKKLEDKSFYQDKLDHLGVKYNKNLGAKKLKELLDEAEKEKVNSDDNDGYNIDELKSKLIEEAIVDEAELEGKSDNEIIEIATTNHLI